MVEKITKNILNKLIDEINKEETQQKIEIQILNPILFRFIDKLYPYIRAIFTIYILNFFFVLVILILIIIIFTSKKNIN